MPVLTPSFKAASTSAGTRQQARELLTTARTMFGEMDMRYWLTQAEAELKELA